jgi:uncharacterized protein (TIGR02231 family)
MRRVLFCLSVLFLLLCLALPVSAEPIKATLFPDSARVTEAATITPKDGVIPISLPIQADPATLTVTLKQNTVADITWRSVKQKDSEQVRALRAKIKNTRGQLHAVVSDILSLNGRIAFWQSQPNAEINNPANLTKIADTMGTALASLQRAKFKRNEEKTELERTLARQEEELHRLTGQARESWRVEIVPANVSPRPIKLEYAYNMAQCGWRPLYRLDARPGEKLVRFSFEAEMWQSSGQNWNNIALSLATTRPRSGLTPPSLSQWIIRPRPQPRPDSLRMVRSKNMAMDTMVTMESAPMGAAASPVEHRAATFSLWDLGKRSLPAGKQPRITIKSQPWPAEFEYTLRPSRNPQGFLTAHATPPQTVDLPQGQALFLADGILLGKRPFSLAGNEADLFFGSNPLVTAQMVLTDSKSGGKGIIGKKQTHLWAWTVTATNHTPHPAKILIEEPAPQPRDKRIKLELESNPKPEQEDHTLTWPLTLNPGQSQIIKHEVQMEAPADMPLDMGR